MKENFETTNNMPFAKFSNLKVSNLKAVTLDCYGTLIDSQTTPTPKGHQVWRTLANFIAYKTGIRYTPEELCEKFFEVKSLEKKAGIPRAGGESFDIEELNVYRYLMPRADEQSLKTAAEIFRAETTDPSFNTYPGVKEFLTAAKQAGLKISLSSNAQRCYTESELKATGIYEFFDDISSGISSATFFRKPSTRFFRQILENLGGLKPEEVLNIGNFKPDDIIPAHEVGMYTCLVNSEGQEVNTPDGCDFYFDYPKNKNVSIDHYPFFRLKKFLFG